MTSILVKALEDLSIEENRPHMISIAKNALSLYSQSMNSEDHARDYYMNDNEKNKTKEEILDGLNIITPLNELEGQEVYSREEVLAAMEEYAQQFQSKENEGKQAGVEKELKEIREAFQWTWDNMDKPHTSDHFNIPANGIQRLDNLISELPSIQSGERGEVERLKGEIKFLESEIGRLGGFIYKPK